MPEWATVSIKRELTEEIRKLLKRTGRYRSISEFVAEAIRLRLEEINSKEKMTAENQPTQTTPAIFKPVVQPMIAENKREYINGILQRSEQTWWVLVKLFGDLARKNAEIDAEYARELRNCRSLINFVSSHICSKCDIELAKEKLPDLQQSLEKIKHDLVANAICVCDDYAKDWINELDKAKRCELLELHASKPKFVPGLPRNTDVDWTRITLSKPLDKETTQEIARQKGVSVKSEDSLHFIVSGEKRAVRKVIETIYQSQLKQESHISRGKRVE